MKVFILLVCFLLPVLCCSGLVQAEDEVRVRPVDGYISGFGGYSFPLNIEVSSGGSILAQDAEFKNSPSFGGKVGLWFTGPRKMHAGN